MQQIANTLREVFSARGYRVSAALDLDPAFRRSRRSESSLVRDLVLDTIERATLQAGVGCIPVQGGGLDVAIIVDNVDRRYRVRKATRDQDSGDYVVLQGTDAIMTVTEADPDGLFPIQRWLFGYTVDAEGYLDRIFEARVIRLTDEKMPRLVLSQVHEFEPPLEAGPSGGGFTPAAEDDLGWDEDEGEDNAGSAAS